MGNLIDIETGQKRKVTKENETEEWVANFSLSEFQVVRREFFAHLREPSATFSDYKFYVNAACLGRFPETASVQVLLNPDTKMMVLLPCPEGAPDSLLWCGMYKGKRKPKTITCKLFFAMLCDLMQWNPDFRYKMLGRQLCVDHTNMIAFDLNAAEIYQRTYTDGEKSKRSRKPVYAEDWKDQFGLPLEAHRKAMQINLFDGYAVYTLKEQKTAPQLEESTDD